MTDVAESTFVDVAGLRVGSRLHMPIHDGSDLLLLAEGLTVTESFLQNLRDRGIREVKIHPSELPRIYAGKPSGSARDVPEIHAPVECPERNEFSDAVDDWLMGDDGLIMPPQGPAFADTLARPENVTYSAELRDEMIDRQQQSVSRMEGVFKNLLNGNGVDLDGMSSIADEALADLQSDVDLFACLGINPYSGDYPARHSMHVSMLAITIGTRLKLDRPTLKELAMGCLIHDAGMLMIDPAIARLQRRLRPTEFLEITKHPVRVFDKMLNLDEVPRRSAYIAYQIHERSDGSGYPRRRKQVQIHFLSQVAAVADTYVALVTPRPHRQGILPHMALQTVLRASQSGQLSRPAAAALLQTLSAYPLGSYIQLNDGRVGTVIRAHATEFERPIVEVWRPGRLHLPAEVVDLSVERNLRIVGALGSLEATFSPTHRDAGTIHRLIDQLDASAGEETVAAAGRRASERTPLRGNVVVYVPPPGGGPTYTYQRLPAISRNISASGMALVTMDAISTEEVILGLEPRPGTRFGLRAKIVRSRELPGAFWEYGVQFLERVSEPTVPG